MSVTAATPYRVIAGLGAGAGAALAMIAVMAILRLAFGFLTIPELMLNSVLMLLGGEAFSTALDTLYYAGRPLLFAVILEGTLLLGAILGLIYVWLSRPNPDTGKRLAIFNVPWGGILYGLVIGVLLNLIFLPLIDQPVFADKPYGIYASSIIPLWLGLMILALVYGLVLQAALPRLPAPPVVSEESNFLLPASDEGRRTFMRIAGGTLLAVVGGAIFTYGGTIINQGGFTSPVSNSNLDLEDEAAASGDVPTPETVSQSNLAPSTATAEPLPPTATHTPLPTDTPVVEASATPPEATALPTDTPLPAPTDTPIPTPSDTPIPPPTSTPVPVVRVKELTPTDSFYHVSKNFFDPSPSSDGWKLEIKGLVQNPYSITYKELLALPAVEVVVGMMCISNPLGGGLIGNTNWKGVRLADLLNKANPKKGVLDIVMTAEDGYTDSITLQKALDPDVVLVWEMAGAPLTPQHGFPARLLVPGIYGMKHVKWLNSIELVNSDYRGYWQQPSQGWSDPAPVNTMSKIDYPVGGSLKLEQQTLSGIAFAGDRSISKVEISTDGGKTWNDAYVKPKLSGTSWIVWAYDWTPLQAGKYTVKVRATDGAGNLQREKVTDPYPNGATGWHTVSYVVK
ncbi:MAG: molybdopterin-dependent oxidoreductase [Chloroflexota bacterium]